MRDGRAPWVWYGGRPSLDLVNTRRNRHAAGVEYLTDPDELADWLTAAGTPVGPDGVDAALLEEAIALREAIDAGVRATIEHRSQPMAAVEVLNTWLADGAPVATLRVVGGVMELVSGAESGDARRALGRVAVDAAQLLGTGERELLRICPGAGCGGRFVDASAAGRRRWCSMAVCGNRAKAARFRVSS